MVSSKEVIPTLRVVTAVFLWWFALSPWSIATPYTTSITPWKSATWTASGSCASTAPTQIVPLGQVPHELFLLFTQLLSFSLSNTVVIVTIFYRSNNDPFSHYKECLRQAFKDSSSDRWFWIWLSCFCEAKFKAFSQSHFRGTHKWTYGLTCCSVGRSNLTPLHVLVFTACENISLSREDEKEQGFEFVRNLLTLLLQHGLDPNVRFSNRLDKFLSFI